MAIKFQTKLNSFLNFNLGNSRGSHSFLDSEVDLEGSDYIVTFPAPYTVQRPIMVAEFEH